MATVSFIPESHQSISAMKAMIEYCLQQKKVADEDSGRRLVSGVNCNGENAFTEFMATKTAHHKKGGMNFYHYVQSFSPNENISAEQVNKIGLEFAEKAWPGHEVLVTTHTDVAHLHNHFVINSVHYENGRKLRQSPGTLTKLRSLSDGICQQHGLSVLEPYKKDGANISSREYRAAAKGDSWKFKLMSDIDFVMNRSGSRADFMREMQRLGYKVTWTDERKYITFTCPNGMKCRDIRLHDEKYLKEGLEYEFTIRKQHTAELGNGYAEEEKRTDTVRAGTDPVSASGVCDPDRTAQAGEQAAGGRSGISAEAVSDDRTAGDGGGAERSLHQYTEYRGGVYGKDGAGSGDGEPQNGGTDAEPRRTGWEESRAVYFELLRNSFQEYRDAGQHDRETAPKNIENYDSHGGIGGGAVAAGLRRSEALGARWSRVDWEKKTILLDTKIIEYKENGKVIVEPVEEMKNKSSRRTLPLPDPVYEMLCEEREKQDLYRRMFKGSYNRKHDDYICVDQLGGLIRPNRVTQRFADLIRQYGLRKIRFHDLRHTFASILINQDVPLLNVSTFLGHSDLSTTANIYAHLDKSKKQESADVISSIFNKAKE